MRLLARVRSTLVPFVLALASLAGTASAAPDAATEGRLLRFPDIHGDTVVFVHGGDLWRAPVAGGAARRLTAHPGQELFPRISPDGRLIAYTAEYTGSRQVYVMPVEGGLPRQLTFYTDVGPMPPRGGFDNWIQGWTADGRILVRMNRTPWGERMGRYYLVDPKGGLEQPLPIPHGGSASLSPDGTKIAYTPIDREFRTWKRTRGGRAQDIWIYDLAGKRSERVTSEIATDNFPMWSGDRIYFTSDRENTLNLYVHDLKTKQVRKLTNFTEYDVLWPSLNGGAIVFMNGGWLYRFDLATEKAQKLAITLSAEQPYTLPHFKNVKDNIESASLSPSGARAVFEARGDLFSVPAKDGPTRNLSRTQGVREMSPAWSPDGRSIAYLSDATGEYELYVRAQDGTGSPRQLTKGGGPWKFAPSWSPDSKKIAFSDRGRRLRVVDVATGAITEVDRGRGDDLDDYAWSPDSRWLAYTNLRPNQMPGLSVYSFDQKKVFELGDGLTADRNPVFSADGKYLFFLSDRDFNLDFSAFEFDFVYTGATRVYAAALHPDVPALFPPKNDEEIPAGAPAPDELRPEPGQEPAPAQPPGAVPPEPPKDAATAKAGKRAVPEANGGKDAATKPAPAPTRIDPAGFIARTVALPGVPAGDYRRLAAAPGHVYYLRAGRGGNGNGAPSLHRFDLTERKEEKVADGVAAYELGRDGKKLLWATRGGWNIADAKANVGADGALDLAGLRMKLDPRAEYRQIFDDGWRAFRDWFYDPAMHGVDWNALRQRYGQLVPFVAHRAELDWILGEMVGELEAGHTYIGEGDEPQVERVHGGMLGCELAADASGRYRIARIFAGENWDRTARSPLTEPGVNVKEGEFLLAIDGEELTTKDNPYRLLEDKAEKPVTLAVGATPDVKKARTVLVRPVASELNLMYIDWVKSRMALVEKLSGGRIGYIHLPDTAVDGNRMMQKLFYGQANKEALIVDDRYNGGGFIPVQLIDYLTRRTMAWWARRDVMSMRSPAFAHDGPKAMLVNGYSSSGGDAMPYFFRQAKLGPIVGTRTWGGLIGLSGGPSFVDGGAPQAPSFRIYDASGKWVVENEGVTPDVEVFDLPETFNDTRDASIEKAVAMLLEQLQKTPVKDPAVPKPPHLAD